VYSYRTENVCCANACKQGEPHLRLALRNTR